MNQFAVQFPKLGLNFNISREAFVIGEFAIYWYAILIAVGAILAVIYGLNRARKYGIDPDKLLDVAIVALVSGIIGARLYYVIFNLDSYSSFLDIINIRDGGLAIYGGLIFGILGAFIVSRFNKMKFLPALDIAAGGFFIGQAIGRWGNFVNQEAFGINTDLPFGMYSDKTEEYLRTVGWDLFKQGINVDPTAPVHPCFLYESVLCIVGFIIILFYFKKRKFDGELFLFYCAWYGAGRGVIEGLRTDSLMVGPFRVSQVLSFAVCIIAVALIIYLRIKIAKRRKTDPDYLMLYVDTKESKMQFADSEETVIENSFVHLSGAQELLDKAQKNIDRLCTDELEESEEETEVSNELEEIANDLSSPEELISLTDKQVELAYAKLFAASSLLERFTQGEVDETVEEGEEDESAKTEQTEEETETVFDERVEELSLKIASAKAYIEELYAIANEAKENLENQDQEEENEEEEEIIDSVSDEADEIDIPSPNDNK